MRLELSLGFCRQLRECKLGVKDAGKPYVHHIRLILLQLHKFSSDLFARLNRMAHNFAWPCYPNECVCVCLCVVCVCVVCVYVSVFLTRLQVYIESPCPALKKATSCVDTVSEELTKAESSIVDRPRMGVRIY